ncbi:MAG: tRNA uridine-5-carboxymethylaminomethyl(34) synthesis GTPase MnmE [Deltaproteobacteria bacterium]|nr:tRNA uridine-5-carboxymethylaminomethyl(34) synthesis GTPase MnmE [Deltaproteobacteria bacterium]
MEIISDETIAAISTPPGNGAIGVVRISGDKALEILEKISITQMDYQSIEPAKFYLGKIVDPTKQSPLDQVMMVWMKAPNSFTGEELVEIHAHGNYLILEEILRIVVQSGARLAMPGEFTRRAFQNGKMDLVQAEAVSDLIHGLSHKAIKIAERQLSGALSEKIQLLKNNLTVLRAQMEAMIDFPEDEDVQVLQHDEIGERIELLSREIMQLLETYNEGQAYTKGVSVAIVGRPNVGKSSLLNRLLGEDRSIVHNLPGTTRDTIEEICYIAGLPVRFVDTAGIRKGCESVEEEGIRRTREKIFKVDLVLALFDVSEPWTKEDDEVLEAVSGREYLTIFNKLDLPLKVDRPGIKISAKTGEGVPALKRQIFSHFVKNKEGSSLENEGLILTNTRHKIALELALEAMNHVKKSAANKMSLEFLAADLLIATNQLAEITGEITNDDLLNEIFSKFCIGK